MVDMYYNYFDFTLISLSVELVNLSKVNYICSMFLINCFFILLLLCNCIIFFVLIFKSTSLFTFCTSKMMSLFSYFSYIFDIGFEIQNFDELIFFFLKLCFFISFFFVLNYLCFIFFCNYYIIYIYMFFLVVSFLVLVNLTTSYGVILFTLIRGGSKTSICIFELVLDFIYVIIPFFRNFLQCFRLFIVIIFFTDFYLYYYDWIWLDNTNIWCSNIFISYFFSFLYYMYMLAHFMIVVFIQTIMFIIIYLIIFYALYTKMITNKYEQYFINIAHNNC